MEELSRHQFSYSKEIFFKEKCADFLKEKRLISRFVCKYVLNMFFIDSMLFLDQENIDEAEKNIIVGEMVNEW